MPIAYALFALISGTLTYGTSVSLELPMWVAAQLTLLGANLGVVLAVTIVALRCRDADEEPAVPVIRHRHQP